MNNIKRFSNFKSSLNENNEGIEELSIRAHVEKIMNALYGMDEKYEELISTTFNEKTNEIKLHLEDFQEVMNILDYLKDEGYNASVLGEKEILIKL